MPNTRAIIDYAADENAVAMRDALYSEIQDRVNAHIESHKQQIAKNLIADEEPEEDTVTGEEENVGDNTGDEE